MEFVLIEWEDITCLHNTEENPDPCIGLTAGWIETKNQDRIVLSTTIYKDDSPGGYSDRISIPLGCIKKIMNLDICEQTTTNQIF